MCQMKQINSSPRNLNTGASCIMYLLMCVVEPYAEPGQAKSGLPVSYTLGVAQLLHTGSSMSTRPLRLCAVHRIVCSLNSCGVFQSPHFPHCTCFIPAFRCTSAHSCHARYPFGGRSPGLKSGVVQTIPHAILVHVINRPPTLHWSGTAQKRAAPQFERYAPSLFSTSYLT